MMEWKCSRCGEPIQTTKHAAFVNYPLHPKRNEVVSFAVTCHPGCTQLLNSKWRSKDLRPSDSPIEWVLGEENARAFWRRLLRDYEWPQDLVRELGLFLFEAAKEKKCPA